MGQKKGLIYNSLILFILFLIWFLTTSKSGYSPPILPEPEPSESTLDLFPLDLTILLVSNPPVSLSSETQSSIQYISNTFSHLLDLTVNLKSRSSKSSEKIKNESQSSKRCKLLIFMISNETSPQGKSKDNVVHLLVTQTSEIPNYLISYLRKSTNLPLSNEVLTNGLTKHEELSKTELLETWLDFQISKQSSIFNTLSSYNSVKLSHKTYQKTLQLSKASATCSIDDKVLILNSLISLNTSPDLSHEEYFKWDFKVGVYAPVFFPVLFPISGAVYSRLFLRK